MQEEDEEDVRKNTLILGDEDALEEDEEFEQQAEEFEHQYNFRYMVCWVCVLCIGCVGCVCHDQVWVCVMYVSFDTS